MNHPAQDLAGLARQILGHSLVVFLSHHDEARLAAPDNADAVIAEMSALAAQRLATTSDEDLRRRRMAPVPLHERRQHRERLPWLPVCPTPWLSPRRPHLEGPL